MTFIPIVPIIAANLAAQNAARVAMNANRRLRTPSHYEPKQ